MNSIKNMNEVLEFIHRRFPMNSNWLDGNCYYFAIILKDRFPEAIIYYEVIYCHFVVKISGYYYDWSGLLENVDEQHLVPWCAFEVYDAIQYKRVIQDCIK